MRTIPGMVILNPADDVEAKACVKAAYEYNGPVYLRFGRLAVPVINDRRITNLSSEKALFSVKARMSPSLQQAFA